MVNFGEAKFKVKDQYQNQVQTFKSVTTA